MAANERSGTESDAIDGVVPARVVTAESTDDVARLVDCARAERLAIVAAGGGTQLDLGNPPRRVDVRLVLEGSENSVDPAPNDMVVTVAAGLTLARANAKLAACGQRLAVAASDPSRATLGGLAAADLAHGIAYAFGRPRDQILGMTVVDGNGRRLRAGGRVVKNVAGYDLPRLFAGSFGTLGVITELTLRTHPLPTCSESLGFEFDDLSGLERSRAALFGSHLPLRSLALAFERANGGWRGSLHVLVEGTRDEIAYQIAETRAACTGAQSRGRPELEHASEAGEYGASFRIECRPSRSIALATSLLQSADAAHLACRLSGEIAGVTLRWQVATAGDDEFLRSFGLVRGVTAAYGATFVVERAPVTAKRGIDVWGAVPQGIEIMKRLKARFDPGGIFSPGRFVGGI